MDIKLTKNEPEEMTLEQICKLLGKESIKTRKN